MRDSAMSCVQPWVSLIIVAACTVCVVSPVLAQDVCADLFKQGYYDEKSTFTTQQDFTYVQHAFCSDTSITYQDATDGAFNLGVNVIDIIDATLGGQTDASSYVTRRQQFCGYNFNAATSSATLIAAAKTVSAAATAAMAKCWSLYPGFSVSVTPKSTLDGFAVTVRDNTGDANVTKISTDKGPAECDTSVPAVVSPPFTFNCSKPQDQTLLLTVNVAGKGTLSGVELYGTDRALPEIQSDLKALWQAIASASCLGCIQASVLSESQFRSVNGDGWVLCQNQSIVGSKLSQATGQTNAPDLRGVFLRGKNYGYRAGVDEVGLGQYRGDTIGPFQPSVRVLPSGPGTSPGVSWGMGGALKKDDLFPVTQDAAETQPKNVTVNFFCKIS